MRRRIKQLSEMMYVDSKALVAIEQIALKATVEPMLMSERRVVQRNVSSTALSGMFQPGLMWPMKPLNGRPPSRAKDH